MPAPNSNYKRVFGQATRNKGGATNYQRQQGNGGSGSGSGSGQSHSARELTEDQEKAQRRLAYKLKRRAEDEAFDERSGFRRFHLGSIDDSVASSKGSNNKEVKLKEKRGWVFNMLPTVSRIELMSRATSSLIGLSRVESS